MKTLRPAQAAKVLRTNSESVRIRMQNGAFDPSIGTACQMNGKRYTYEIFPERLAAYLDISVDEVFRRLNICSEQEG